VGSSGRSPGSLHGADRVFLDAVRVHLPVSTVSLTVFAMLSAGTGIPASVSTPPRKTFTRTLKGEAGRTYRVFDGRNLRKVPSVSPVSAPPGRLVVGMSLAFTQCNESEGPSLSKATFVSATTRI
jgi:hypothetical protein